MADFRSRFSASSDIAKLQKKIQETNSGGFSKDERYWSLELDKTKVGSARIRFLPAPDGEELPWVRIFQHTFKGPRGSWFWENCPTTINLPCPVCENNTKLWNTEEKALQDIVRSRKRKLTYVSNILVVEDPLHPENEGKVFLFKYGKSIFDKITEKMNPSFKGEEPINPFDFWEGCDFKIRAKFSDGFIKYNDSEWAPCKAVSTNDVQLEAIYKSEYKLQELIAPSQFKTYEELKQRFKAVVDSDESTDSSERYVPSENISTPSTSSGEPVEPPFDTTPERSAATERKIVEATTKKPTTSSKNNLDRLRALAAAADD